MKDILRHPRKFGRRYLPATIGGLAWLLSGCPATPPELPPHAACTDEAPPDPRVQDSVKSVLVALDEKDLSAAKVKVRAALESAPDRGLSCAAVARTLACDRRASSSLMGVVFEGCRSPSPKDLMLQRLSVLEHTLEKNSVHLDEPVLRDIRATVENATYGGQDNTTSGKALDDLFQEIQGRSKSGTRVTWAEWQSIRCWFCPRVPYCECICSCGKEICAPKCGK